MQPRPDPRRQFVVTNAEQPALRLNLRRRAPAGDERTRQRGVAKIDPNGIVQHAAHAGRNAIGSLRAGPVRGFVGTAAEAVDVIGQYQDAGVDLLISADPRALRREWDAAFCSMRSTSELYV